MRRNSVRASNRAVGSHRGAEERVCRYRRHHKIWGGMKGIVSRARTLREGGARRTGKFEIYEKTLFKQTAVALVALGASCKCRLSAHTGHDSSRRRIILCDQIFGTRCTDIWLGRKPNSPISYRYISSSPAVYRCTLLSINLACKECRALSH